MRTFLATGQDNVPIMGVPKGTLAIYNSGLSGTDDTPAIAPLGNLDKIAMHSALDYLGVVEDLVADVTFPAGNFLSPSSTTQTLYAHGQGPKPLSINLFSADGGATWLSMNGTVFSQLVGNSQGAILLMGRTLIIQVDATNFYVRSEEIGNLSAQTLKFRTLVLSRTFGTSKSKTNETFFASPGAVRANGGLFDTTRRYLQSPAVGQTALIAHKSGQTLTPVDGDESAEINIFIHNHINFTSFQNGTNANGTPIFTSPTVFGGAEILENDFVLEGPASVPDTIELSATRMRIGDGVGGDVFDTQRKTLALLGEFNGQFVTSTHPQGTFAGEVPHEFVHATVSLPIAPGGAVPMLILGWLEIIAASGVKRVVVTSSRPTDLSGSVLVTHTIEAEPFGGTWIGAYSTISARIVGTSLQIVESWFHINVDPAITADIPSYTFNAHVFACGLLGGF